MQKRPLVVESLSWKRYLGTMRLGRVPLLGLTLEEGANFRLARLEPDVPEEARALSRHLYAMLPRIDLPDLLMEVNDWAGFFHAMLDRGVYLAPSQFEAALVERTIAAAREAFAFMRA